MAAAFAIFSGILILFSLFKSRNKGFEGEIAEMPNQLSANPPPEGMPDQLSANPPPEGMPDQLSANPPPEGMPNQFSANPPPEGMQAQLPAV